MSVVSGQGGSSSGLVSHAEAPTGAFPSPQRSLWVCEAGPWHSLWGDPTSTEGRSERRHRRGFPHVDRSGAPGAV